MKNLQTKKNSHRSLQILQTKQTSPLWCFGGKVEAISSSEGVSNVFDFKIGKNIRKLDAWKHEVTDKAYANMKAGFPKMRNGGISFKYGGIVNNTSFCNCNYKKIK